MQPEAPLPELYFKALPFMARMLKHRLPSFIETDDLVQEGAKAMLEAAGRYDPSKGPFWPFVKTRARGAMIEFVGDSCRETCHVELTGVRVLGGDSEADIGRKVDLERALGRLDQRERRVIEGTRRGDSVETLAKALKITRRRANQIRKKAEGDLRKDLAGGKRRREVLVA